MGYLVELWHHRPTYRRGDLEDETVIIENKTFKTRKEGKEFIEKRIRGKEAKCVWRKGDKPSYCYYFTGKTWIHENTGEECLEEFTYFLKKV